MRQLIVILFLLISLISLPENSSSQDWDNSIWHGQSTITSKESYDNLTRSSKKTTGDLSFEFQWNGLPNILFHDEDFRFYCDVWDGSVSIVQVSSNKFSIVARCYFQEVYSRRYGWITIDLDVKMKRDKLTILPTSTIVGAGWNESDESSYVFSGKMTAKQIIQEE